MMHLAFLGGLGWRDGVLLLAAMIGVYLVLSVMRLFELAATRRDRLQPGLGSASGLSAWDSDLAPPAPMQQMPQPSPLSSALARRLEQVKVEVELQRLRSENTRLNEVLAKVAEDVARLKAARQLSATMATTASAIGDQRNYRLPRHHQRRGSTAGCANAQSYEFEWHQQDEDPRARTADTGSRLRP